jgi:hypothetical protein
MRAQRLTRQPLHHEVAPPAERLAEREDIDDVGMADLVDDTRFVDEARHRDRVRAQLFLEHLDRGALADHRMDGREHDPHPADAEPALDPVLTEHRARLEHEAVAGRGCGSNARDEDGLLLSRVKRHALGGGFDIHVAAGTLPARRHLLQPFDCT